MRAIGRRRRRTAGGVLLAACLALGALSSCGSAAATPLPTTSARGYPLGDLTVQRRGRTVLHLTVEIADTPAAQEHGLMGVRSLAADQGMAFVFPRLVGDGFWMKDTLIPLDIAFVDARGSVVDVQHMVPCTSDPCRIYYAAANYTLSVETASGTLTRAGVHDGDTVSLTWRAPRHSPSASPG